MDMGTSSEISLAGPGQRRYRKDTDFAGGWALPQIQLLSICEWVGRDGTYRHTVGIAVATPAHRCVRISIVCGKKHPDGDLAV
jgi:hypothetical protein